METIKKVSLILVSLGFFNFSLEAMVHSDDEEENQGAYQTTPSSTSISHFTQEHSLNSKEELLDYKFANPFLRVQALQPRTMEFERLEFLGDRVLGLTTASLLCKEYPSKDVEWLAVNFEQMVSKQRLLKAYEKLNIDPSELKSSCYQPPINGPISEKTASDVVEAFMGGIYKDGGLEAAQAVNESFMQNRKPLLTGKGRIITLELLYSLDILSEKPKGFVLPKELSVFQNAISYQFKNERYLYEAFRHPSTHGPYFQRFDFVGVRILALVIADKLFTDFPNSGEGTLTSNFGSIINNNNLEGIFEKWQLRQYLKRQRTKTLSGLLNLDKVPNKMAVNTLRALIGAAYLDGGWKGAQSFALKLLFSDPPQGYIKPNPFLQMRKLPSSKEEES